MDWSKDNVLAIALDKTIYLWDASSGNIDEVNMNIVEKIMKMN